MPARRVRQAPAATPRVFPLRAVAGLFLERQHLDRPRGRRLTAASLTRFAEDVGGIQIDSINVLDRAHYLTAWSRFGPFDRVALDRLAYSRRVLLEYWAHAACFVPRSHLPAWRRAMLEFPTWRPDWKRWVTRNRKAVGAVEGEIRARGPLASADFRQARPRGAAGWWNWKPATYALHYLWMTGAILVHSRVHFHKRFDLAERVIPKFERFVPPPREDFLRWHLERALHAMGAATALDLRMYLTFPNVGARERARVVGAMLERGEATEIEVAEDGSRWLVLARDLPALARAARRRAPCRGTTFLSPFDSFLWHRARTLRLFGFDYRVEFYTPGSKRRHGYYSLPILHDGQLIGRIDAKNHREHRRLEVRALGFEAWFARGAPPPAAAWGALDRDRALAGVADALGSLARFTGAERVDLGKVTPPGLAAAVRRLIAGAAPGASSGTRRRA